MTEGWNSRFPYNTKHDANTLRLKHHRPTPNHGPPCSNQMAVESLGGVWIINRSHYWVVVKCCTPREYPLMICMDPKKHPSLLHPPSLIAHSFCSFTFCSFSLYIFACFSSLFFNYCSHPRRTLSLWTPPPHTHTSQEKRGDATMWLHWQWHEWPRWQGHLSEDWDMQEGWGRGDGEVGRRWQEWKGVGKMSTASTGSTLIFLPLFSVDGKEFSVPRVVWDRKVEWGEGGEVWWLKSWRTTSKQEAKLQQISNFYRYVRLDVKAVPRRPIKVNDRELFSP